MKNQDKANRIAEIDEHIRRNFEIIKVNGIFQINIQGILSLVEIKDQKHCLISLQQKIKRFLFV